MNTKKWVGLNMLERVCFCAAKVGILHESVIREEAVSKVNFEAALIL
jgi:hypothetical protein